MVPSLVVVVVVVKAVVVVKEEDNESSSLVVVAVVVVVSYSSHDSKKWCTAVVMESCVVVVVVVDRDGMIGLRETHGLPEDTSMLVHFVDRDVMMMVVVVPYRMTMMSMTERDIHVVDTVPS